MIRVAYRKPFKINGLQSLAQQINSEVLQYYKEFNGMAFLAKVQNI